MADALFLFVAVYGAFLVLVFGLARIAHDADQRMEELAAADAELAEMLLIDQDGGS